MRDARMARHARYDSALPPAARRGIAAKSCGRPPGGIRHGVLGACKLIEEPGRASRHPARQRRARCPASGSLASAPTALRAATTTAAEARASRKRWLRSSGALAASSAGAAGSAAARRSRRRPAERGDRQMPSRRLSHSSSATWSLPAPCRPHCHASIDLQRPLPPRTSAWRLPSRQSGWAKSATSAAVSRHLGQRGFQHLPQQESPASALSGGRPARNHRPRHPSASSTATRGRQRRDQPSTMASSPGCLQRLAQRDR